MSAEFTLGLPKRISDLPRHDNRTVIVADVHATPWMRTPFDGFKINVLEAIFDAADNVILNGDFAHRLWYFPQLRDSEFGKRIFPILRARNTIYVSGNHDWKEPKIPRFYNAFVPQYSYLCGDQVITVKHGHQFADSRVEQFVESPRGKFIRPVHRALDNWMTQTVVGGWLSFLASRIPNREHHKIVQKIDNRMFLMVVGHRHTLLDWSHKGLVSLGHWGREASWVVTDRQAGARLHYDFIENYIGREPNTAALTRPRRLQR